MTTRASGETPPDEHDGWGGELARIQPVRKAHEQIYDQLRTMILTGGLPQGHRFPSEPQLAERFGVSRTTVRSALRLLVSDGLVRTHNGAGGGTFVTLPSVNCVSDYLMRSVELLSHTDDVTLAEFLQARELVEIFALRQLIARHTPADLEKLRSTIPSADVGHEATTTPASHHNFHQVLIELCRNTLLQIAAQPIHFVLERRISTSSARIERDARERCRIRHGEILDAVENGGADVAEELMRAHLHELESVYEGIWASRPRT